MGRNVFSAQRQVGVLGQAGSEEAWDRGLQTGHARASEAMVNPQVRGQAPHCGGETGPPHRREGGLKVHPPEDGVGGGKDKP